jgi:ubiquinone/menaquinone biosynthesis C-methylase UbiE
MTSSPDAAVATILAYDGGARRYSEHSRDRGPLARLRERLLSLLPPSSRILDLGSGPCHDAALLAASGARVVALDPAVGLLREAAGYASIAGWGVQGDARQLPLADASFDGIWSCASLLHIPHAEAPAALSEAFRVLRPGGVAFFSVSEGYPSSALSVTDLGIETRMYYYHDSDARAASVLAAGFEIVRHTANRDAGNFNPASTAWLETYARRSARRE